MAERHILETEKVPREALDDGVHHRQEQDPERA